MIATTFTQEEINERIQRGDSLGWPITPQMRALQWLTDVAKAANELGLQGHGVKHVELIETQDFNTEDRYEIRVVPDFKLKK